MTYEDFLNESIDRHQTLSKRIFDFDVADTPVMFPTIRQQILIDAACIEDITPIEGAFVVGNILTKNYGKDTPIDVAILIDRENIDEVIHSRIMRAIKRINGRLAGDTRHPILYFVVQGETPKRICRRYESVYSVHQDKWIKRTKKQSLKVGTLMKRLSSKLAVLDVGDIGSEELPINPIQVKKLSHADLRVLRDKIRSCMYDFDTRAKQSVSTKQEITALKKTSFGDLEDEKQLLKLLSKSTLSHVTINELLRKMRCEQALVLIDDILGEHTPTTFKTPEISNVQETVANSEMIPFTFLELTNYRDATIISEGVKKLKAYKKLATSASNKSRREKNDDRQRVNRSLKKSTKLSGRKTLGVTRRYNKLATNSSPGNIFNASRVIDRAKKSPVDVGRWMLTPGQAQWVAAKYHCNIPDHIDPIKHLSNMPIVLYVDRKGVFWIVKDKKLLKAKSHRSFV